MNKVVSAAMLSMALLVSACTTPNKEPASPPKELQVIVFPGGFNWPIWAGLEKGLFARQGVLPKITPTPNSRFQLTGLIDGKFDIAMTAVDNIVAYREGQGGVDTNGSELVAVMGGDNGFLRLVGREDIKQVADFKGKQLSVDSLTTGYAFVLLEILERNGLVLNRDYQTVAAGGVLQRYDGLVERKHAGTLLVSPFEVMAKSKGLNQVVDASSALGSYQGLVAGVRRSWAAANQTQVVAYIRGYQDATAWLYDPKNKEEALALFMKNVPNSTRQSAEVSYSVLLAPQSGFQKNAAIDKTGVQTVLNLRQKYGQPKRAIGGVDSYYDSRYFDQAIQR